MKPTHIINGESSSGRRNIRYLIGLMAIMIALLARESVWKTSPPVQASPNHHSFLSQTIYQPPKEVVTYFRDWVINKAHNGYAYETPPRFNGDWTQNPNFANGTIYYRAEIKSRNASQVSAPDMQLQLCFWQDNNTREACGPLARVSRNPGTVVTWSTPVASMVNKPGYPINWSRARQRAGIVVRNLAGNPVSNLDNLNWSGENPDLWYPLDMKFIAVVVAEGETFSGWQNYVNYVDQAPDVGIWDDSRNQPLWTHRVTPAQLADTVQMPKPSDRGRVRIDPTSKTIVTDNGRLLRGEHLRVSFLVEREFLITHMERLMDIEVWKWLVEDYHLNAVRLLLYREPGEYLGADRWNCPVARCFTTVQDALPYIDAAVEIASDMGMYIIIDYHPVGGYVPADATEWWSVLAPRYKDRTHVLYELANEPVKWDATQYNSADIQWQKDMYQYIRKRAPNTHIILWTFAGIQNCCMLPTVSQANGIDYTNASVGYHPYQMIDKNWTPADINQMRSAGYPLIATEYGARNNNDGVAGFKTVTDKQETVGTSWMWLDGTGQGHPWGPYPTQYVTWERDPLSGQPKAVKPQITPGSGQFSNAVEVSMKLSSPGSMGAMIRYTLDGSLPSEQSTLYTGPFKIMNPGTYTIRAIAFKKGYIPSAEDTALVTVNEGGAEPASATPETPVSPTWWNNNWDYRVLVTGNAAGFARQDKPAEVFLNFTALLTSVGAGGTFDPNSIRVIEVDDSNNVIDTDVPFQFDTADDYNPATRAAGTLIWLMEGTTSANATRRYHVYFDVTGKGFTLPNFTPLITTSDNIPWAGYQSIRVVTQNGTYYYHKPGGGFASLIDAGNNDWISWNSSTTPSGAAGDFRGIPNMIIGTNGGFFHPGRTTANTTLVRQGPLKASFRSTNNTDPNQGEWETLWEVFPTYARMTVTKAPNIAYWFLYEGTPGGLLEPATDFLVRSNGDTILASGVWNTDIPNEEWIYAADPNVNRSIYLIHHVDDDKVDGYYQLGNLMTVFGFGRKNLESYLTGNNRRFTIGLVDSTTFGTVQGVVYNAWKDLTITVGNAEGKVIQTPTASETPRATPETPIPPTASPTPNLASCYINPATLIRNPGFESGTTDWIFYSNVTGNSFTTSNQAGNGCGNFGKVMINTTGNNIQLYQSGFAIQSGTRYRLRFDARAGQNRNIGLYIQLHNSPNTNLGLSVNAVALSTNWQTYEYTFTATGTTTNARLRLWLANIAAGTDIAIDNFSLIPDVSAPTPTNTLVPAGTPTATATTGPSATPTATITPAPVNCNIDPGTMIRNPGFESGNTNWVFYSNVTGNSFTTTNETGYGCGKYGKVTINTTGNNIQLYQSGFAIQNGTRYRLRFDARANTNRNMALYIQLQNSPYTNLGLSVSPINLSSNWQTYEYTFTATGTTSNARLRLWLANIASGTVLSFDNFSLTPIP